jgi:hypothetical protein
LGKGRSWIAISFFRLPAQHGAATIMPQKEAGPAEDLLSGNGRDTHPAIALVEKEGRWVPHILTEKEHEEVVNKDHKGSMSKAELQKRDRIAKKLKERGNIKRIKTEKRLDSQEEAEYRTATFQVFGHA